MRVLVLGGMHGNEPLGLAVAKLFQKQPVENVEAVLANEEAIERSVRFVNADLNRSFPGSSGDEAYEARRAAELLGLANGYDVVLDFHNTQCPDNDCGFLGDAALPKLYDIAWLLGLSRVIVADYECINKYAPNCLSVEISLSSEQNDAVWWYERIVQLSRLGNTQTTPNIARYRFVYRMTLEDKIRLDLPGQGLRAFKPLSRTLANAMGVSSPAYPIFIGDGYTPYNYGGLLNKIN